MTEVTTEHTLPDRPTPRRHGRRGRLVLLTCVVALLAVILLIAGGAWWAVRDVSSSIERIPDVFTRPDDARPSPPPAGDSMNILLAGLDSEETGDSFERGEARTDAVMILHLDKSREQAWLISFPRDTWVPIPGHGQNKINAAYSLGGPSLYVQTVEELTGLRMDHLAVIDWSGFRALTDALGGVTLTFTEPVVTWDGTRYQAGTHTLSGDAALQYVRERKALPRGDFDRVQRQQNYLRALMRQLGAGDLLSDPGRLVQVLDAVGQAAKVDEELSATGLMGLALSLRSLGDEDVTFLTVPTLGTGWAG
ncbi:MAG TPA: LCP family protein, partial [Jiangellaceae bacterium]